MIFVSVNYTIQNGRLIGLYKYLHIKRYKNENVIYKALDVKDKRGSMIFRFYTRDSPSH